MAVACALPLAVLTAVVLARTRFPGKALLDAVPKISEEGELKSIEGNVPNIVTPPPGCRFHTRCPFAVDRCFEQEPLLETIETGHLVACHRKHETQKLVSEKFGQPHLR